MEDSNKSNLIKGSFSKNKGLLLFKIIATISIISSSMTHFSIKRFANPAPPEIQIFFPFLSLTLT